MKQVTNRIVDLFKGLIKSATLGQRDSLIELAPVVSSVIELPGPLKNANFNAIAPSTLVGDTTYVQMEQFRSGVGALSQVFSNQRLDAGLWHITGFFSAGWNQAAVPAALKPIDVGIFDPDGSTAVLGLVEMLTLSGTVMLRIDSVLSLDRTTWGFICQIPATLAGESVFCRSDLVCNKLL